MSTAPLEDVDLHVDLDASIPCSYPAKSNGGKECETAAEYRIGLRHAVGSICPSLTPFTLCPDHHTRMLEELSRVVRYGHGCSDCGAPFVHLSDIVAYDEPL